MSKIFFMEIYMAKQQKNESTKENYYIKSNIFIVYNLLQ